MIIQIPGKRYWGWFLKEENATNPIINYAHSPSFPLMAQVLNDEYDEMHTRHPQDRPLGSNYHRPELVKSLPSPNNAVRNFENSRHVWHFKDTETEVEFIFISDGLRKNHYKGSSIEVLYNKHGYHKDDSKLSTAYKNLKAYFRKCYLNSLEVI